MSVTIKRVYEEASDRDGFRVLVDRVWPRGMTKEKAKVHLWAKSVAPTTALRQWFGHDPAKWDEFRKRYREELNANASALDALRGEIRDKKKVTLLYGAKDETHNQAVVLQQALAEK